MLAQNSILTPNRAAPRQNRRAEVGSPSVHEVFILKNIPIAIITTFKINIRISRLVYWRARRVCPTRRGHQTPKLCPSIDMGPRSVVTF